MAADIGNLTLLAKFPDGQVIIGVDEAGRGPLAGPVVAAACVLGVEVPPGLDDSKKLSARRRAELEPLIHATCHWALGLADVEEIDRINIFAATMLAMTRAVGALVAQLGAEPVEVLIDGNLTPNGRHPDWRWQARAIVGRDRLMRAAALEHPHYGWERNMGYGTAEHLEALRRHGPSPLHRRSFAPVAQLDMFA